MRIFHFFGYGATETMASTITTQQFYNLMYRSCTELAKSLVLIRFTQEMLPVCATYSNEIFFHLILIYWKNVEHTNVVRRIATRHSM